MCQECGHDDGFDLLLVSKDRLLKRCRGCAHKWLEERERDTKPRLPGIRKGGWIYQDEVA